MRVPRSITLAFECPRATSVFATVPPRVIRMNHGVVLMVGKLGSWKIGVKSLGPVAQMILATIIHSSYKHGNTNQVWRYCHDGSADRVSAEDLLSSYEP